jgi:hypothetical protein
MVLVFPPFKRKIDEIGKNVIDYSKMSSEIFKKNLTLDMEDPNLEAKVEATNIFNLPFLLILINLANTVILVIKDLFNPENYRSINSFLKIFLIENRLLYIGIFIIILSLFVSFFDF